MGWRKIVYFQVISYSFHGWAISANINPTQGLLYDHLVRTPLPTVQDRINAYFRKEKLTYSNLNFKPSGEKLLLNLFLVGMRTPRLGRVMAIRILAILHVISSLIVAFTTNFTALLVARFFVGLSNLGILVPAVTLGNSYINLSRNQGLPYHRTCKPDFLYSWPSLNSYLK